MTSSKWRGRSNEIWGVVWQVVRGVILVTAVGICAAPGARAQVIFTERNSKVGGATLRGWAASADVMVVVGDGGRVLRSTDGAAWTPGNSGGGQTLRGVTYGAGKFVAVGDGGRVAISEDGVTWSSATTAAGQAGLLAVSFGHGRFVAVGGGGVVLSSTDAQTWTAGNSGVTGALREVGWMPDAALFVAVGDQGVVLRSPEGASWQPMPVGTTDDFLTVATGGGFFYAATRGAIYVGTVRAVELQAATGAGPFRGVAIETGPGPLAVAVGDNGAAAINRGNPWRQAQSGTTRSLMAAGFARTTFFAVGEAETILQGIPTPVLVSESVYNVVRNLSSRGQVTSGSGVLISGFVVSGSGTKRLLVRAAGPALGAFGVSQRLLQPKLTIFDVTGRVVAQNAGWGTAGEAEQITALGRVTAAFAFPSNSADCALILQVPPGVYTAHVSGSATGIGLVEVYDTEVWPEAPTARLTNMSSRCFVGTGDATAITGVVLPANRKLLIRAVGPGLAPFGVAGTLADPHLELVRQGFTGGTMDTTSVYPDVTLATNENWNEPTTLPNLAGNEITPASPDQVREAIKTSGAFPLTEGSKDAAMLVTIARAGGAYTFTVRGADGGSGVALVEVYDLGTP